MAASEEQEEDLRQRTAHGVCLLRRTSFPWVDIAVSNATRMGRENVWCILKGESGCRSRCGRLDYWPGQVPAEGSDGCLSGWAVILVGFGVPQAVRSQLPQDCRKVSGFKPLQLRSGTPRGNYRVLNHTSVFDLVMFSACNEYRVLI